MADVFRLAAMAATTTNTFTVLSLSTAATAIVRAVTICNSGTSGTAAVDLLVQPTTATGDLYLFRYTSITAAQTVQPLDGAIVLGPGSELRLQASTANVVHVSVSYLESE
jgi:hypothetical protein